MRKIKSRAGKQAPDLLEDRSVRVIKRRVSIMPIPTTVTFKGMTVSEPLRRAAISRAQKLSQFADISNCEVTFRSDTHRRHRPNRFCVQVSVSMRGERLGAGYGDQPGVEGDHIYVLLSRAFEALTRRIEDAVRRLRGDVKNHMPPFTVL